MKLNEILRSRGRITLFAAILLTILLSFLALNYEFNFAGEGVFETAAKYFFISYTFIFSFLLFYLKKGSKIRWLLFSMLALLFSASFIVSFFVKRGHIGFTEADVYNGIPTCHISLIQNLLSLPILKVFVSPGNLTGIRSIYSMIVIWFWATILIGKGWCSWGCFYGGWDNLFSRIRKKPLVSLNEKTINKLRFLPYALLITIAVLSVFTIMPVFCTYICPFKTVTEFRHVTDLLSWALFIFSVGLFITACIILPIIFGKRIWCAYVCPFGAFQNLVGRVFRVFRIKIDKDKCINCGKCVKVCQVSGITKGSLEKKKTTFNCSLCGKCIEECPQNAISVSIFHSEKSISIILEKLFSKVKVNTFFYKVKEKFIRLIHDILHPISFLYFFGLTVYFTFFTSFYKEMIEYIKILIK